MGEIDSNFPDQEEGKESFGEYLRRHREASGKTIDGISRATRIAKRFLQAFEENQTERLPDEAFTRGFLKAYAREVGLDVEDTIVRYERFKKSLIPTQVKEIKKPAQKPSISFDADILRNQKHLMMLLGVGGGLAVLVVALILLLSPSRAPQTSQEPVELGVAEQIEESEQQEVAEEPAVVPSAASKVTAPAISPLAPLASPVRPSILQITAVKVAKLTFRIDENPAEEVEFNSGESKTFNVFREIEIRSADRTAFQFQYNGKPLDISGPVIKLFNRHLFAKP